jgi:enoyl-CoA hydratase/carnithine racemase
VERSGTSGVRVERVDRALHVVLDEPARHNRISAPVVDGIRRALAAVAEPVVILRSSQPGVFCSGADLTLADEQRAAVSDGLYALYEEMRVSPAIIIAAVDGPAVGGGAQLALAADVRIAGPTAWLRFVGVGHGLVVGAWGLPALVGRGRALEICLSMRKVPAAEAAAIGLVDRLADDPRAAAEELAAQIATAEGDAVVRAKRLVRSSGGAEAALAAERHGNFAVWDGSVAALTRPIGDAS